MCCQIARWQSCWWADNAIQGLRVAVYYTPMLCAGVAGAKARRWDLALCCRGLLVFGAVFVFIGMKHSLRYCLLGAHELNEWAIRAVFGWMLVIWSLPMTITSWFVCDGRKN
jgi:hypothetical protein